MDKKKKKLKIFDLQRDGKGISKKEPLSESGIKRFFITYKNNFTKLIYVNIFMVLGNFPLFFIIATLSGVTKNETLLPLFDVFQNLGSIFSSSADPTPFNMTLYSLVGLHDLARVDTVLTYVFYGIGALFLFTFGCVNVGTAYILRNIAMGEPVFTWSDFWYAVKRNWKQALPFGVFDAAVNALLLFNIFTMISNSGFLFWSNVAIFAVYFVMRYYIYIQMVTFDLSIFKILKNSLIFSILGFKRNILAVLAMAVILVLEFMFFSVSFLLPVAVAAPLAVLFASFAYIKVYAAYFKIKEVMIDPYKAEHPEIYSQDAPDDEIIMRDDVTEKERLEEIKKRNNIQ